MVVVALASLPPRTSRVASPIPSRIDFLLSMITTSMWLCRVVSCPAETTLANSIAQGGFDCRARLQSPQHNDGIYGGKREFRGYIVGNAGKPEHVDLELLPGRHC